MRNVFCDRAEFDNRSEPTAIYFVHNDNEKIIFDRTKRRKMALLKVSGSFLVNGLMQFEKDCRAIPYSKVLCTYTILVKQNCNY